MKLEELFLEDWTNNLILFFEKKGCTLTIQKNQVFKIYNFLNKKITLNNEYGFLRIIFNNDGMLRQFSDLAEIVCEVEFKTEEELDALKINGSKIPDDFKQIDSIRKPEKYTSIKLPCRIYSENNIISFYDYDPRDLMDDKLYNRLKSIDTIIKCLEKLN
jgi:flagellin-specific chaperone FliS